VIKDIMTDSSVSSSGVARASLILALGNVASRVLGLLRDVVLSNLFGASRALEAFNNAVLVSRAVFDLLIAGHVNSAIVPVLSDIEATQGREALYRVLRALAGVVLVLVGAVALMVLPLAGPIADLIGGEDPDTLSLTASLLRLTSPSMVLLALFALYSGALYALRMFTYPALAAAAFNGTLVLVTLVGGPLLPGEAAIGAVAVGWVLAALAQLALQLLGLRRGGAWWPALNPRAWRDPLVRPALRKIGRLYVPVMGALAIDLATTRFLTYALAANAAIAHGNVYITWATTLMQFPQGLVATAISAAVLPSLSRSAALLSSDSGAGRQFNDMLGYGLRLTTALILPAAVGLGVLAVPVIRLLFEHGMNTPADTQITAAALRWYLVGLPFAAWDLLLIYGFYARQDTRTPALVGVVSLMVYTVAALLLTPVFGLYALMMADAVKHITHALISAVLLWRRIGGLSGQRLLLTLMKASAGCAALWGMAALLLPRLEGAFGFNTTGEALEVLVLGAACTGAYIGVALLLRLDEIRSIAGVLLRRTSKPSG
jgi:putative peptidoglycan lipid II flippase